MADIEESFKYIKLFHTKERIILKEQYIPIQVTLERKYKHEIETSWAYTENEAGFKRLYAMKGFDEELQKRKEEETKRVVVDWEEAKKENQKINGIETYLNNRETRDFRKKTTEELIKELSEADGIIQKLSREGEQYLFLHRTFQEYFTAYYLNQSIENNKSDGIDLAKKLFWEYDSHETLTLLASLMKNPMLLIEALFKEKDDIFQTLLLLAGRCIVEVEQNGEAFGGISQNSKLIAKIINRIYKFWRRYPNVIFIESVVVALGKVNSWMSQELIAALKDSESDVRRNAASALGKIGNAEALNEIIHDWEIDIYEGKIFTSARTLAVRFSKQKEFFIPVYPELVRFNPILTFVKRRLRVFRYRIQKLVNEYQR